LADLNWQSGTVTRSHAVEAIPPLGLDMAVGATLVDAYEQDVNRGVHIITATARLFDAVRAHCPETVTDEFEIALIQRMRAGRTASWKLRKLSARSALAASPTQLAAQKIRDEQVRTWHALDCDDSKDGRRHFLTIWRAWLDGAGAVFGANPNNHGVAELYELIDKLLDELEEK
jgi:hypothetical protein